MRRIKSGKTTCIDPVIFDNSIFQLLLDREKEDFYTYKRSFGYFCKSKLSGFLLGTSCAMASIILLHKRGYYNECYKDINLENNISSNLFYITINALRMHYLQKILTSPSTCTHAQFKGATMLILEGCFSSTRRNLIRLSPSSLSLLLCSPLGCYFSEKVYSRYYRKKEGYLNQAFSENFHRELKEKYNSYIEKKGAITLFCLVKKTVPIKKMVKHHTGNKKVVEEMVHLPIGDNIQTRSLIESFIPTLDLNEKTSLYEKHKKDIMGLGFKDPSIMQKSFGYVMSKVIPIPL